MLLHHLTLWSAWYLLAVAQSWRSPNFLCDKTFDEANATGVFEYSPDVKAEQRSENASWAYTVYDNATRFSASWWYNTGGANYTDDFGIGYDACAFRLLNVTRLAMWHAHNDPDDGSCKAVLGEECIEELKELVEKEATDLVGESSPNINLTEGALPQVCSAISEKIKDGLPKKCKKYFDEDWDVDFWQLTDYNNTSRDTGCCSDLQYESCPIYANRSQAEATTREIMGNSSSPPTDAGFNSSIEFQSSWNAWWGLDMKMRKTKQGADGERMREHYNQQYDYFTQGVWPMLTVYMSVANQRRSYYVTTKSALTCVRALSIKEGSRNVPYLHPDAHDPGNGLSKGAIGGIAAGSVIGATIILVAAFLFWRHRKAAAAAMAAKTGSVASSRPTELGGDEAVAELDKGNEIFEKEGNQGGMEMDAAAKKLFEMQGDHHDPASGTMALESPVGHGFERYEMQGDTIQSELESPAGTTLVNGTLMSVSDEKRRLEEHGGGVEKKEEQPEVAELMGSEPVVPPAPQQQGEDQRQSWTPSVRVVENVADEGDGAETEKEKEQEQEKEGGQV